MKHDQKVSTGTVGTIIMGVTSETGTAKMMGLREAGASDAQEVVILDSSGNVMNGNPSLDIPSGGISGTTSVNKFGRNTDIDTAVEDVWDGGGTWVAPTQVRTHDIVSTSTSDDGDPVGVGARTIRVYGLTGWGAAEVLVLGILVGGILVKNG